MEDFLGWVAYYRLEPWGEERADLRAGIVAAAMRNSMRGRGTRSFRASDFMPRFGNSRAQSDQEVAARLLAYVKAAKAVAQLKKKQRGIQE